MHPQANPRCKNTRRLWAFFSPTRMDEIDFLIFPEFNLLSDFLVLFVFSWLKVQKIWCHFICQLLDPYYETGLCAWFDGRWRGTFALFNFLRATKISRTETDFLSFLFVFCFPCIRASLKFLSYLGRYGRNLQDARMHAEILRIFSENLAFFPKMGTVNRCIRASSELATIRIIGIWLYASWAGFWINRINPPL